MTYRLLSLLVGYILGCVLTAELVSYGISHQSIRTMGSGNPGMTNALRIYGKKWGLLVLMGDLVKTFLACVLAAFLFPLPHHLAILYAGLGSILGHNFPFWNGFHGGKGVACTCMALFCFSPILGLLACVLGLIACLISQYLAIGGTLIPAFFLIISTFTYHQLEITLLCLIIFLLMLGKSAASLKRIFHGTEERGLWLKHTTTASPKDN